MSAYVVFIIGLWRALAVGTLHAYHSIRIKFMQSRGLPLTEAGALFAEYDGIGIAMLPLIAILCRLVGLKPMLAIVPVVTIGATIALFYRGSEVLERGALLLLSVMEVFVPIIPLAILPANASRGLGAAFGVVEVMFITIQTAVVFVLGIARTASGYPGAFVVMIGFFAAALAASLPAIVHSRDYLPWKSLYYCSYH